MKLIRSLLEVVIDNKQGWGAVPNNQEVDYFGLRVLMKPSVFLKLALRLEEPPSQSIKNHISNKGSIGAPWLDVSLPEAWFDGDFSTPASVKGHEGRNRMHAILDGEGDVPVETHLFFRNGVRSRDLTSEMKEALRNGLVAERTTYVVHGPIFEK